MKRKIIISLIMTILMVSTIAAGTINTSNFNSPGMLSDPYPIEVCKQVWNGEGWADTTEAEMGDTVKFKITITYYETGLPDGHKAINITAIDTLPTCLEYDNNANYDPSYVNGKKIMWNLTEDYEIELYDEDSVSIEFDAKVIDYGENVNYVEVYALERCSGADLYGDDDATVIVEEEPWIEVNKTVWDPTTEEWIKILEGVKTSEPVRFQISITYHGETPMKCMEVWDYLPGDCLIYEGNEEFIYPNSIIEDPDTWVSGDYKEVMWDWKDKAFYLEDGETIKIRFDAKVVEYCCCYVENWVYVYMWGCNIYLEGCDYATVHCCPPDWEFDKKVWNGEAWVEEGYFYVGDIIKYKIDLTYYGNGNLTEAQIIDELPCVILYEGNANIEETGVSSNLKTTWWNLTEIDISDGETLSIIFDAIITGQTGDCQECGINTAYYYADDKSGEDTAKIHSTYKEPAEFCIKIKSGWGKAKAIITNTGESAAEDVLWDISLTGGRMNRIQASGSGIIDELIPNQQETISTAGKTKWGFGRVTVEVSLYMDGGEEPVAYKTADGFVIGKLVFIRPINQ